jgi:enoyl-[acyl-carrier protein] reductase I
MELLEGKYGLILGIANERSYAWHIAKALEEAGAELAFNSLPGDKNEARTRFAVDALNIPDAWIQPCDVSRDEDIMRLFESYAASFPRLDFLVHSLAFADRDYLQPGKFAKTPRASFLMAMDISVYSLIAVSRHAHPLMVAAGGGSIMTMTHYGGDKVFPGYNAMGACKAALEATVRYLAEDFGQDKIRVNAVSGGAFKTLAASGIGGIKTMLHESERRSPLRRNVEGVDVGGTAVYLASDLSSGVTGETIFVDCGMNILGG